MTVLFGSTANNYLVLDWASVTAAYFFGVKFDAIKVNIAKDEYCKIFS